MSNRFDWYEIRESARCIFALVLFLASFVVIGVVVVGCIKRDFAPNVRYREALIRVQCAGYDEQIYRIRNTNPGHNQYHTEWETVDGKTVELEWDNNCVQTVLETYEVPSEAGDAK